MKSALVRSCFILSPLLLTHCGPAFLAEQSSGPSQGFASLSTFSKSMNCDPQTSAPGGTLASKSTNKIYEGFGGSAVDKQSWLAQSSVMLTMVFQDKATNKASMFICTAMLLDRDVLLTAAHCVADKPNQILLETRAFFDTQPECNANNELNYGSGTKVTQRIVHPAYQGVGYVFFSNQQFGDLALVKLEKDAPSNWKTVKLSAEQVSSNFGQILSAGFGRSVADTSVADPEGLILRFATLDQISQSTALDQSAVINQGIEDYLVSMGNALSSGERASLESIVGINNHFNTGANQDYLYVDQTQGKGICSGDSGGAAYLLRNGEYYAVGVASMVGNSADSTQGICAGYAAYTQVLRYRNWIESSFSSLKKSTSTVVVFE